MKVSIAAIVLLVAAPALALDYPCPSDPGFCYFDVGNDGCFDGGTDAGPINAGLENGTYNHPTSVPGSIVCPPSVNKLALKPHYSTWATAAGGDILFYAAKLAGGSRVVESGGDILVGGRFTGGLFRLVAQGDVFLEAGVSAKSHLSVYSGTGRIVVEPKVSLKAGTNYDVSLWADSGALELGAGVKLRAGRNVSLIGDSIDCEGPKLIAGEEVNFSGGDLNITGLARIRAKTEHVEITTDTANFERVTLKAASRLSITTSNLSIADPFGRSSKIKLAKGGYLDVDASGVVSLVGVDLGLGGSTAPPSTIAGSTSVGHTSGKTSGAAGSELTITSTGTCDVTGTTVKNTAVSFACGSVVGP